MEHTGNALKGMLLGSIATADKGAVHMGVKIGIAHGDVEHFHARGGKLLQQPHRLCRIKIQTAIGSNAEAVGVRKTIVHIQPGSYQKITAAALHSTADTLAQQPSTVLQRAAVTAGTVIGRKQL